MCTSNATGLSFALSGTEWVSINEVSSGLACNCQCPKCGSALMAKKGKKQRHHFAHHRTSQCVGAEETMLHRLAKHLLVQAKQLRLPPIIAFPNQQLKPAHYGIFKRVSEEYNFGDFRADVWLTNSSQSLAVEIQVNHASSAQKIHYYVRQGIPALEINVKALYKELLVLGKGHSLTAFRHALLHYHTHRHWLFHPQQHAVEYRERKQSTLRAVAHSIQNGYHHYQVYRCPRRLRFVRGGFRDGQAYARVFQDCLHCEQCRGIEYAKQWIGFKQMPQQPTKVYCWEGKRG